MSVLLRKEYKRGNSAASNTVVKYKELTVKSNDLTGMIFGKLKVLKYLGVNYLRMGIWQCECVCGTVTQKATSDLKKGMVKSCGCITNKRLAERKVPILDAEQVGPKKVYKAYKQSAKVRKIEFNLDFNLFKNLILKNCYYCGVEPSNTVKLMYGREMKYNGLDRVENNLGYVEKNVLTCCITCNKMKSNMEITDFAVYVIRLLKHSKNWIKFPKRKSK